MRRNLLLFQPWDEIYLSFTRALAGCHPAYDDIRPQTFVGEPIERDKFIKQLC